jgi:trimethylamine--corrinoid protein Co-methyltransferase
MVCNLSEVLTPAGIEAIHNTSMRLLAETGVQFPNKEAISVFSQHGCKIDGHTVYLSENQVMQAVHDAPAQFTIHARNPDRSVVIGNGESVFIPAYGAPFLVDPAVGKRNPTFADYHNLARLAHALPNQDLSGHLMVEVNDELATGAYLNMIYANILHSDKPFMGSMAGVLGARRTLEMAKILFGEPLDERPVTLGLADSLSPLRYSGEIIGALLEYVHAKQPVIIAALIMAGATGPITLAGVLAQQNAEVLAAITLAQMVNPGTPVIYGGVSTIMDMKTGTLSIGSPEMALLAVASAQIARFYELPLRSGGALTDANTPDSQAGYESMLGLLTAVNSGIDLVLHAAGILSSYLAFSYEKFVLDDEMCGMVRRLRQGINVNPDALAFEVINRVGHDGHFLLEPHTVERCRNEFWQPAVNYRAGLDIWLLDGQQDAAQRAQKRWQTLLAEHVDPPLDRITARQLKHYVQQRTQSPIISY